MQGQEVFERFGIAAPFALMTRLIAKQFIGNHLDGVFEEHRRTQYEYILTFSAVANAVADVAMNFSENFNQAYKVHKEDLSVSLQSFYDKIKGVESSVSEAVVQASAAQASDFQDQLGYAPWEVVAGYRCFAVDGNFLSKTHKRLGPLREADGAPLPGKVIARFDLGRQVFDRAYLLEDAHAQESSTCAAIANGLQPMDLVIADRNFCVVPFLERINSNGACFVIRQHGRLKGVLLGKRRYIGSSNTGKVYEQAMQLSRQANSLIVRRITVELDKPTRDNDTELHLLTNLPEDVSGLVAAESYRHRWEEETAFHVLQMTFTCEHASVGHPHAALFLFCLSMVAFNLRQVLFAALFAEHDEEDVIEASHFHISKDISDHTPGMLIAISASQWAKFIPKTIRDISNVLREIASTIDMKKYRKARRGVKKKKPFRSRNVPSSHISTARQLKLPPQTHP